MTALPSLDDAGYRALLDSATGAGHHAQDGGNEGESHTHEGDSANGAAQDHGEATEHKHAEPTQSEPVKDSKDEHDHSTHDH
jgi:hypothetical protein